MTFVNSTADTKITNSSTFKDIGWYTLHPTNSFVFAITVHNFIIDFVNGTVGSRISPRKYL